MIRLHKHDTVSVGRSKKNIEYADFQVRRLVDQPFFVVFQSHLVNIGVIVMTSWTTGTLHFGKHF